MLRTQLGFDPIDQLEHVVLITPRESERTDRLVHGAQGLMDSVQVCGFHGWNVTQLLAEFKPLFSICVPRTRGVHGPCRPPRRSPRSAAGFISLCGSGACATDRGR
jgi:hypothetical protein